jgi:archaellin
MGIGTLIIFIAIILVAAIAAAVLITTQGVLQQKALVTGREVQQAITLNMRVVSIIAGDTNTTDKTLERFEIVVRTSPGSPAIDLSRTIIKFNTEVGLETFYFNSSDLTTGPGYRGNINWSGVDTNNESYYMREDFGDGNHYLKHGELFTLFFQKSYPLTNADDFEIIITPEGGMDTIIISSVPAVIEKSREYLYPFVLVPVIDTKEDIIISYPEGNKILLPFKEIA